MVNAILGEERVIVFNQPGTTRDSIYIDFERDGHTYTIIDTAGVRRRAKVNEMVEKFSVIKTIKAIEDANVAVLVLDAQLDVSEQDATIAGFALAAGRALVVAVNKWDSLDVGKKEAVHRLIIRKLSFLSFAKFHYISAIEGRGVSPLFQSINEAYIASMSKLATPSLTRVLKVALERQQPPRAGLVRPKMRYEHQGGRNPPVVVVHGNALGTMPTSYTRYLEHTFLKAFKLQGTPLRVQYKSAANPFDTGDEKKKSGLKSKPMSRMRGREKEVRYGKHSNVIRREK